MLYLVIFTVPSRWKDLRRIHYLRWLTTVALCRVRPQTADVYASNSCGFCIKVFFFYETKFNYFVNLFRKVSSCFSAVHLIHHSCFLWINVMKHLKCWCVTRKRSRKLEERHRPMSGRFIFHIFMIITVIYCCLTGNWGYKEWNIHTTLPYKVSIMSNFNPYYSKCSVFILPLILCRNV